MPLESPEFRTSLQKLLVGLILILVPLTVFGFYVALQGDSHMRQMNGENFRAMTLTSVESTSQFIATCVRDVSVIANTPGPVEAVTLADRQYEHLSEEAVSAKITAIEQAWESSQTDGRVHQDPHFRPGAAVAPRARTESHAAENNGRRYHGRDGCRYGTAGPLLSDRPGVLRAIATRSQGTIHVSDLRYDDQSHLYYVGIAYPILQEGTGRFIGAVTAMADVSPVFAELNRRQMGRTGRMFLVREDGTVVEAPGVTPAMQMKSEEYAAIKDALGSLRGRETGYIYATLSNGQSYLIGFADTGLKEAYPNLPWIVLASQEARELNSPIRNMTAFALLVMILALLMLTLLGAYVFLHRRQDLEDIETPENKGSPMAAA